MPRAITIIFAALALALGAVLTEAHDAQIIQPAP